MIDAAAAAADDDDANVDDDNLLYYLQWNQQTSEAVLWMWSMNVVCLCCHGNKE